MTFRTFSFVITLLFVPCMVSAEVITEFQSNINLLHDGSFEVTERITYDFEDEMRHGIFRTIPLVHPSGSDRFLHTRYIDVEVNDVRIAEEREDAGGESYGSVPYELSGGNVELTVKIGDPDRTITGVHTYEISYTVRGALTYYEDGVDLYWNVTGSDWGVPIEHVIARLPDTEGRYENSGTCYRGEAGETESCDIEETGALVVYTADNLAPGEGLTIARAVDPETVEQVVLERLSFLIPWIIGAALWILGLLVFVVRYSRKYRTGAPIIPQYEPYGGFKPMYTGLLFDDQIDPHDITAGIVYLAEQGFFKIKRIEKKKFLIFDGDDYEIMLTRPYTELDSAFKKKLFTLLFDQDAAVGSTILLSELSSNAAKQKENHTIIEELKRAASEDLVNESFFEQRTEAIWKIGGMLAVALIVLIGGTALLGAGIVPALVVSAVVLITSLILLAFTYRRRTTKGHEALDHLKGFKEFLSVTDKERFAFHNAPKRDPETFMAYLPYAIAFKVEKEWAKVFDDITIPQPDWYEGEGAAFNAVVLTNSLSTFSTTLSNASGATAASAGGGSAGGGAGGGGGGSW